MDEIRDIICKVERKYGWKLFDEYTSSCSLGSLPPDIYEILENLYKYSICASDIDEDED